MEVTQEDRKLLELISSAPDRAEAFKLALDTIVELLEKREAREGAR